MSDSARQTVAALDAMEENLRRRGLGYDGAADPLKARDTEASAVAYMESIRAAQNLRRKLRVEREYRQHISLQQDNQNVQALSNAVGAREAQNVVDAAPPMLQAAATKASEQVDARVTKQVARQQREAQGNKQRVVQQLLLAHRTYRGAAEASLSPSSQRQGSGGSRSPLTQPAAVRQRGTVMCSRLVDGLVELATRVSDNRFLAALDLGGHPIRRVDQELLVSDWNAWVDECLWQPMAHADEFHEEAPTAQEDPDQTAELVAAPEIPEQQEALDLKEQRIANSYLGLSAHQQALHEASIRRCAVEACMTYIHAEEGKLTKRLLDDLRRKYDEDWEAALPEERRQEVFPGWAQRLMPAGCFVFGDDLSGVKLLVDTIEKSYQVEPRPPSENPNNPVLGSSKRHSLFSGSMSSLTRAENGLQQVLLTPRILLGSTHPQSVNRLPRAGASGKATTRSSSNDDDDRKELEALAEHLCRELVSTHIHNLHILTNGKTPAVLPSLTAPVAPEGTPAKPRNQATTPRGGPKAAVITPPAASAEPTATDTTTPAALQTLRCLVLLGFPQAEAFYRALHQRLNAAVEVAEIEILEEQKRQADAATEAALPPVKGGSRRSISVQPRQLRNAVNKGNARGPTSSEELLKSRAALQAKHAFPPLCVLGYFMEYDLPTRHKRLRGAYVRGNGGTLHHTILNPETVVASTSPAPLSNCTSREDNAALASTRGSVGVSLGTNTNLATVKRIPRPTPQYTTGWDVEHIRAELLEQRDRMLQWHTQWTSYFTAASLAPPTTEAGPHVVSPLPVSVAVGREKHARGKKAKGSRRASRSVEPAPGPTTREELAPAPAPPACVAFPHVLFFQRRDDVSEALRSGHIPLDSPEQLSLGSLSTTDGGGRQSERDRVLWIEFMLERITDSLRPSSRLLSQDNLVPGQLPAPLRLNDYRLPATLNALLVQTLRDQRLSPADSTEEVSPHEVPSATTAAVGGTLPGAEVALLAELEVFRAFTQHTQRIFQELQTNAFTSALWGNFHEMDFSNTGHFSAIDSNYKECRSCIKAVTQTFTAQLRTRCSRWFLACLEDALASTQFTVQSLCNRIVESQTDPRKAAVPEGGVSSPTTDQAPFCPPPPPTACPSPGEEDDVAIVLPSLAEEKVQELLEVFLTCPSAEQSPLAMESFWTLLDPFIVEVHHSCEAFMLRTLTSSHLTGGPESAVEWAEHVPTLVRTVLEHTLAVTRDAEAPQELMSNLWPSSFTMNEAQAAVRTAGVSPYLARCTILLQDVLRCLVDCEARGLAWLEALYKLAVDNPVDSSLPDEWRPVSVEDLFLDPSVAHKQRCNLSGRTGCLPLATTPSAAVPASPPPSTWARLHTQLLLTSLSLYNRPLLRPQELLHACVRMGICQLGEYVEDSTAEEAMRLPRHSALSPLPGACGMGLFAHLTRADCRPGTAALLTVQEMETLISSTMGPFGLPRGEALLDAQAFFLAVAQRRCCFCPRAASALPCIFHSEWTVPQLSAREIRRAVLDLPRYIQDQYSMDALVPLVPTAEQLVTGAWLPSLKPSLCGTDHRSIAWSILQGLTACFCISKRGVLRKNLPPLPLLLQLFTLMPNFVGATIERMYHAVAAVQYARQQHHSCPYLNANAVTALDADKMLLNVDDFCYYFVAFGSDGVISLADDATMFTQAEKVGGISLPDLLSSHWGRALIRMQKPRRVATAS